MTLPDTDDAGQQLTTKDGWRRFVAGPPKAPDIPAPSPRMYATLPLATRQKLDGLRIDHHSRLMVVATSTVRHTVATGRRLVVLNRHAISARRGLIVSGPAGTGKTIAVTQLGLAHELHDRGIHPDAVGRIPVLYITVPPAATARMIAAEFARFLGLPVQRRLNTTDIIEAVVGVCTTARTGLVIVDFTDVHLLDTRTRTGAETSDQMKHLGERIPATFVYAGVEVETSPLLTGQRGAQLAGRFKLQRCMPLPYGTAAQREMWVELVSDMEQALRLDQHRAGTLARHAEYLHHRTGGAMGSLSHLIREAALAAILDGSEKITKQLLQSIQLDFRAEQQARPSHRRPTRAQASRAG
ncbi:TniB family NTP-binding protein [Kitasatospora aureofaciens]|uniref:TniB family NTP-binding protein n=1 Tax=Kitasatospora aureofaciens TaxID=1894 RepID=UPI0037CBDE95